MTEPTSEEVAGLLAAAKGNKAASERLARTIHDAFRPFRWLLAGLLLIGMLQLYGTWNLIDGRNTSRANQEIIKDTQATLLDCTTPEGACSKRNATRTAAFLAELIERFTEAVQKGSTDTTRAVLEIRRCAFGDIDQFEACIRERLPADAIPED